MKERSEIKAIAKLAVKQHYGAALGLLLLPHLCYAAVALVLSIVTGFANFASRATARFGLEVIFGFLAEIAVLCVSTVLLVGQQGGYAKLWRGEQVRASEPFAALSTRFMRKLGGMAKMGLMMILWSALPFAMAFVGTSGLASSEWASHPSVTTYSSFPIDIGVGPSVLLMVLGYVLMFAMPVVKMFAYSLTGYLLAEYPSIPGGQVIRLSARITKGHKGKIFVMELSFLGWILLGTLTFHILTLFYVLPYMYAAMGGLYTELVQNALQTGAVTPDELGRSEFDTIAA